MSWRRFHSECWFALRPTGFRQATGLDSAYPNWVLPKDERGDDVLDGRENRGAETALDGRQEREPNREPARQRPEPQRRDRKGSSAWLWRGAPNPRARPVRVPAVRRRRRPPIASPRRAWSPAAPRMTRGATALAIAPRAADGGRAGGVRERRRADVAQGDDHRAERSDVPLAARRPGQLRIPLLRIAHSRPVPIAPTMAASPTSRPRTAPPRPRPLAGGSVR